MEISDIDFAALYREHMARVGRRKSAGDWDARADEMNRAGDGSSYVRRFIESMDFSGCSSLLDVGCGTGAIALAAASRLQAVFGLDYSPRMLELFMANARARGLGQVQAIRKAWEDDWRDVPECDIVVASRSTAVADMGEALAKLNAKARKRVYLTSLASGHFVDPAMLEALGRPVPASIPGYIYIVNILHRCGIHPRLDYIEHDDGAGRETGFDDFARSVGRFVNDLSPAESDRLRAWYEADPQRARRGAAPSRWAFISWEAG